MPITLADCLLVSTFTRAKLSTAHQSDKQDSDPHESQKPDADPHQSQNSGAVEAQNGAMVRRERLQRLAAGRVCRPESSIFASL